MKLEKFIEESNIKVDENLYLEDVAAELQNQYNKLSLITIFDENRDVREELLSILKDLHLMTERLYNIVHGGGPC